MIDKEIIDEQHKLLATAEKEGRDLNYDEQSRYDYLEREMQKYISLLPVPDANNAPRRSRLSNETRVYPPGTFRSQSWDKMTMTEKGDMNDYLMRGLHGLTSRQKQGYEARALMMDSDVMGGFLVMPEAFASQVIQRRNDMVTMRQLSTLVTCQNAHSLGAPVLDHDPGDYSIDFTAEIKTGSEDSSMDFEKRVMLPHPVARRIKVSNTLIRRNPNSEILVRDRLGYVFSVVEEYNYLQGNGVNRPLGVLVESDFGIPAARDITSSGTGAIKPDDIHDAVYSVKQQYRKNAVWILSRDAVKAIRKLKTGEGDYLWKPGLSAAQPETIAGYKFFESEYFPTYTSGNYCAIFGDFSYYWIVEALSMQIQVLTELYAATNQTGFIARLEIDGAPVCPAGEAFARIKLA